MTQRAWTAMIVGTFAFATATAIAQDAPEPPNHRTPTSEADLEYWLRNMIVYHRYSESEVMDATGLSAEAVRDAVKKFNIDWRNRPERKPGDPLTVLPYPGGRHPRINFRDGAIRPQRETKLSVFTPWDPLSYVVVDVPEAVWSNLGLTYLAHTHVPTLWTEAGVELEKLEWKRRDDGSYYCRRMLPNRIAFSVTAVPTPERLEMRMTLTNGTDRPLTGMRIQNCVMLKAAAGFETLVRDNKLLRHPYVATRSRDGRRWIITAWSPCIRVWGNDRCPCMHSDPILPDADPGETVAARGYLWFYEGDDIDSELARLVEETGWKIDLNPPQFRRTPRPDDTKASQKK